MKYNSILFGVAVSLLVWSSADCKAQHPVNLGLSVKWASCNLGASAPEETGDYYAWADPEPNYLSMDPLIWKDGKKGYFPTSYKWYGGPTRRLSKYCTKETVGTVDNKTVIEPADDAARQKLGGSWRIPTIDEWAELQEKCSWVWTYQNGTFGYRITASNGNSIFLPAGGFQGGARFTGPSGWKFGLYWSSNLSIRHLWAAWCLEFGEDKIERRQYDRYFGYTIRPVSK